MGDLERPNGRFRWVICALLFFATTLIYTDRAVVGVLKPTLMEKLHWTETDFGDIVSWFSFAYAISYALSGRFMDAIGLRLGYGLALAAWSVVVMGHGLVRSVLGFSLMRAALGLAEGGNFPAAIKCVSEWHPKTERALATGVFNAGSNVGVIVAPLIVPILIAHFDWPAAFYVTGAMGLVWLLFWVSLYWPPAEHPRLSQVERQYIQSDPPDPPAHIPWSTLLRYRQVWAVVVGMGLSAPIWWFYLYWTPGFFHDKLGIDLKLLGWPLVTVYVLADAGSVGGGWLSSRLLKKGWTVNASRKITLLICALCVVPVFLAAIIPNPWVVVVLIGIAAAAHQGFSANIYTLASDMAPRKVVSSIVGLGGFAAGFIAMGFQKLTGRILDTWTNGYLAIFAVASCAYLINLVIIHLLVPRMEPMIIPAAEVRRS
ncbi:MAG TPA: MFS transporter [Lacipirellulaceae bacterium]|jgi:ACS family hexuronate transporter-like MFS transporter